MIFESCCFTPLEITVLLPTYHHLPLHSHQVGMTVASQRIVPADKGSLPPLVSPPGQDPTAAWCLLSRKASPSRLAAAPPTQGPAPTMALLEAFLAPLCTPPTPCLAHSQAERQDWSLVGKGRAQGGWEFKKDQPLLQPSDAHPGQRKMLRAEERGHVRRYACPGISFSWVKASCAPGKRHRGVNLRRACWRSSPCSTLGWAEPRVLGVSEWRPH